MTLTRKPNWRLIPIIAALILVAILLSPAATAGGPRLVIDVPEPFVFDGDVRPAGSLALRPVSQFTPSTTLCEVCLDGDCLGMVRAERVGRGESDGTAVVVFERDTAGRLVLVGFSSFVHGAHGAYRFQVALL